MESSVQSAQAELQAQQKAEIQAQQGEIEKLQSELAAVQALYAQAPKAITKDEDVQTIADDSSPPHIVGDAVKRAVEYRISSPPLEYMTESPRVAAISGTNGSKSQHANSHGLGFYDTDDGDTDVSAMSLMPSIPQSEQELWGTSRAEQSRHEELQRRILESRLEKHSSDMSKIRESCKELEESSIDYEFKFAAMQRDAARLKGKLRETEKLLAERTAELESADERIQHLFLALTHSRSRASPP